MTWLVALDLVRTIQPFVVEGQIVRQTSFPQTEPTDNSQKFNKLDGADFDDLEGLKKKKTNIKGDWGWPATNPPMMNLVLLFQKYRIPNFWGLSF